MPSPRSEHSASRRFRWAARASVADRRHSPTQNRGQGKRVLLQVVEAWLYRVTAEGLPPGVAELRDELLADDELKNT